MRKLLEELFSMYYRDVYNYLYSLSHDAALSEDLASEVFLEVVKSIRSFRGEADVKTWLFAIARNRWHAYLRKKKRSVETVVLSEFLDNGSGSMENTTEPMSGVAEDRYKNLEGQPESVYDRKELLGRIHQLLNQEPERTKGIVLMRMEGYSYYEISQKYGISEASARVIEFRAKGKIREILKKEGLGDE